MEKCPAFPTIRQEAKHGGLLSEHALRLMLARGELPGFYTGKTFRINHSMLVDKLNTMSAESVKQAVNND